MVRDILLSALFGFLGIVIMAVGYKIFDLMIPLDFNKELEKNNTAVAIVIAGLLIGIALIVSRVVAA
ncbi:MAG: putative rane protein [Clostridiaceae bacterium]|nr:putative rane protein [Clostridiaceae bacterium]